MSTTPKSSPATRASEKRRLSEGSLKIEFNTPNKKVRRQSAPLNGSKLSAGAYKDHTCPSCNQDLRHRKLSKVNFQKHVDKCEKVYPFIVNDNECKFCGKTGRVGYIGNHILETHSPQMNGEEETAENRGVPDGQDKTPEPNAVKHGIQKELMYDFSQKEFETGYELDLHSEKVFKTENDLRFHFKSAHAPLECQCEICYKRFTSSEKKKKHLNSIHASMENKCHKCKKILVKPRKYFNVNFVTRPFLENVT